jgi:hypothetical protein
MGGHLPFPREEDIPTLGPIVRKHFVRIISRTGHTALSFPFKNEQEQDSIVWAFSHYIDIVKDPYPT